MVYDFTNVATIYDDLTPEMMASEIDLVAAVYIDNSQNGSPFNLSFNAYFNINVLPGRQGIYPVLSSGGLKVTATSAGAVKVTVIYSNTNKPPFEWGAT